MNRDLRSYNRELIRSIADELGIPEEKVPQLVSKIAELVKPQVSDFVGRRALLAAGIGGLLTAAMASPAAARLTLTDSYIDLDGEKFYPSSVAPYSAIVYKDGNVVKAEDWKGKIIARGEAGVDDASVIQKALDLSTNGVVFIKAGIYTISSQIAIPSNTMLIGEGTSTVLKMADGANLDPLIGNSDPTNGNENIVIAHLKVDGNRANNTLSAPDDCIKLRNVNKALVFDVEVVDAPDSAFVADGESTDITFLNCRAKNIYDNAFYLSNVSFCRVIDFLVDSTDVGYGIAVKNTAKRCLINSGRMNNVYRGMILDAAHETDVSLVKIFNSKQYGIAIYGASFCSLSQVEVREAQQEGIIVDTANYNTISNCTVYDCSKEGSGLYDGLRITDGLRNVIKGCKIYGSLHKYGIEETGTSDKNIIANNVVVLAVTGQIATVGTNTIVDNNITS